MGDKTKQGLILEGLSSANTLQKNKLFLQESMRYLEKQIRKQDKVGLSYLVREGIAFELTAYLNPVSGFGLGVYQEGDLTVIGLPCKYIGMNIDVHEEFTQDEADFLKEYAKKYNIKNKYTAEQLFDILSDKNTFHKEFGDYLLRVDKEANSSFDVKVSLNDESFPMYKTRDCLPLVSFDFKKNKVYAVRNRGIKKVPSLSSLNVYPESFVREGSNSIFDYVCEKDNVPYGLLGVKCAFDVDGVHVPYVNVGGLLNSGGW